MDIENVVDWMSVQAALHHGIYLCLNIGFGEKFSLHKKLVIDYVGPDLIFLILFSMTEASRCVPV